MRFDWFAPSVKKDKSKIMGLLMNSLRGRVAATCLTAAAFAASLVYAPAVQAQEQPLGEGSTVTLTDGTQPVVVVTVGSVNKLMKDVTYVTGVAGQPQFGGIFSMMAGTYAQGMNMDQPIGLVVPMVAGTPQPIAILPTGDIKSILKRLEAQTGPVDELDDGTLVITINQNTIYVKQSGNNAIAAQSRDALKLIPADPASMFKGMGNAYDLAVRLKVQQIPVQVRNMLIDQMRQGFEQAMAQQQDAESARDMAETTIGQLEQLIQESDELNLGLNIDEASRAILVDFSFTAVGGSKLAAVYGGQQPIPSQFSYVIRDDAAAYLHGAASVGPEAIDQAQESIANSMNVLRNALKNEGNLNGAQVDKIEQYVSRVTDIIKDSLAEGKSDVGALLLTGPDKLQFVLGSFVADGNEVATLAKDLAKEIPESPDAPKFMFDQSTFSGVTMHTVEVDIPADEEEARKIFGEKLQVRIGTAPKAIYVAAGRDSESLLKEFITAGQQSDDGKRPLSQFKLRLLPILEFAQSIDDSPELAGVINALRGTTNQGQIEVVSRSIPNGSASRLSIGEGLLKAIGAATTISQQRAAQQQGF
jgi:hypothetical protein